jgi:signal peptidase II
VGGAKRTASAGRQRLTTSLVALGVLALDQGSKAVALARLLPGLSVPVLGPVLSLTLVKNPGAAFGLLGRETAALGAFAAAVALLAWWLSGRTRGRSAAWGLGLLLGGALGNLIDRVARHGVVDFLNVHIWPVFNLADSAITIGALWLFWQAMRQPVQGAVPRGEEAGGS